MSAAGKQSEHHFTRDDNLFEHFTVGETIVHPRGRTVSDAEHMLWTNFVLNTAQLHFNQKMCDDSPQTTFGGRRVVYGGIVFAYVAGLASEETEENAEVVEEWNVVASSLGHRAPRVEDDENLGEQLVTDGIEEAVHDQMLEARKEERKQEG